VSEYPKAEGDPYYPIPRKENTDLYKRYQIRSLELKNVYFTGRLASYKYYNMDQVVAQSLSLYKQITGAKQNGKHVNGKKLTVTPA
jgi:UDP-galactopyranose mutase